MAKRDTCVCNDVPFSPLNKRNNPSLLLSRISENSTEDSDFNLVIDVCKTFREACLSYLPGHVRKVDAAILTHSHMDAIGGLDELREVQIRGSSIDLYMDDKTKKTVSQAFPYLFPTEPSQLYVAKVQPKNIQPFKPLFIQDLVITPIPMWHGAVTCLGFVIRQTGADSQFVYFSDFRCQSSQPPEEFPPPDRYGNVVPHVLERDIEGFSLFVDPKQSLEILKSFPISVMILDCIDWGRERHHISHASFVENVGLIRCFRKNGVEPGQIYFTGMGCTMDHEVVIQESTAEFGDTKVAPAYDGQKLNL
eukprot:TRINITY_DN4342_c0_g1_i1.p1 TRINITY_DN4342_c0_g1~~TRINITY_DN4342_c0_g1_i1.p1  ORF type:complete len:307 (-),score=43.32 TRINITY_DN4342_c0_g1_i1:44-964(-)